MSKEQSNCVAIATGQEGTGRVSLLGGVLKKSHDSPLLLHAA